MKVISGKLKGRVIKGFTLDGTRPTMDRVKESLCASIQDYIPNSTVLDLFAGSGNLGIEMISMGADKVYFNDYNNKAYQTIKENINDFKINQYAEIYNKEYKVILSVFAKENVSFDIILLDPPYKTDYIEKSIELIEKYNLLADNGIIVCESDSLERIIYTSKYKSIKSKKYGDKYVEVLIQI